MRQQSAFARHFVPEISLRREHAAVWLAVGFGLGALAGTPAVATQNERLAEGALLATEIIWLIGGSKVAWLILLTTWRSCDRRIHSTERKELLAMILLLLLIYQVPFLSGLLILALIIPELLKRFG